MSDDVRELLRQLAHADLRAAVWGACQCARTVLHCVPEGEMRPGVAIETAEAWVRGRATRDACWEALSAVCGACPGPTGVPDLDAPDTAAFFAARRAWSLAEAGTVAAQAATNAVSAAAYADIALTESAHSTDEAARAVAQAAVDASTAAYNASIAAGASAAGARERHLAHLLDLVSSLRWPLTLPAPEPLATASGAVAMAWDLVAADHRADHSVLELLGAHARAGRLGLDWCDPVARAIAERAIDEGRVRELLAGG